MNRLDKLKKELKDPSLHFRHECEGFRCGAHKSWEEGFDAASAEYEKIIAELEAALDKIGHDTKINCDADDAENECFDVAQVALQKLKEFRG